MVWSMVTPLASPVTCQRKVDDWPIRMEVGSAVNWAITGAAGLAGGATGVGVSTAGVGGGGSGAFLLPQPAANAANRMAMEMAGIERLSNMNIASRSSRT